MSLLLCMFDVFDGGMVSLVNSTVELQNLPAAVRILKALPAGTSMDASRPNLQVRGSAMEFLEPLSTLCCTNLPYGCSLL
mgnify:CR=1 FL=1